MLLIFKIPIWETRKLKLHNTPLVIRPIIVRAEINT